jgi:radical SAM superfamily enzyme YgiQ (UPF0313 family)
MKKRILMVRAPERRHSLIQQIYTPYESLGLAYVTAYLRQHGHHVVMIDGAAEVLSAKATLRKMKTRRADMVGFAMPSLELAREYHRANPEAILCFGGHHTSLVHREIMNEFPGDPRVVVIRGEGEIPALELVRHLDDRNTWGQVPGLDWWDGERLVENPPAPFIQDLDSLPFPARDHLHKVLDRGGQALITASRGCFFRCTFCSIHIFYQRTWRTRSPEGVVTEIKQLIEADPRCRTFWFVDDDFFAPQQEDHSIAREFFERVLAEGLQIEFDLFCRAADVEPELMALARRAGLRNALVGVESGVQRVLNFYRKGTTVERNREAVRIIQETGANAVVEFIMFEPWMTIEEVAQNLRFLKEIGKYNPYMLSSKMVLHRGTQVYDDLQSGKLPALPMKSEKSLAKVPKSYRDFYVHYRFRDKKVELLYEVVYEAWRWFEPIEKEMFEFEAALKLHHHPAESLECYRTLQQLIDQTSLELFEEALQEVLSLPMNCYRARIAQLTRRLCTRTRNFSRFVVTVIAEQLAEIRNYDDRMSAESTSARVWEPVPSAGRR